MHLPNLVRAYSKLLEEHKMDIQLYKEGWNDALESLKK